MTWLAGWNYGEPSKIVKVRELDDLPGYVEITEAPRWFTLTSYMPAGSARTGASLASSRGYATRTPGSGARRARPTC